MQILIPFFLYFAAEISLFVMIGGEIGAVFTIVEVFGTGWFGIVVLKTTGRTLMDLAKWRHVNRSTVAKVGGVRVLAGLLFLLPGFLTDGIALFLFLLSLIPVVKTFLNRNNLHHHSSAHDQTQAFQDQPEGAKTGPAFTSFTETLRSGQARPSSRTSKPSEEIIEGNYTEQRD